MSGTDHQRHYVLFPDVSNAQKLYGLMKAAGLGCTLAPTPREADRCCGVSVLYRQGDDRARIEAMIRDNVVSILRFFDGAEGDPGRMKFC